LNRRTNLLSALNLPTKNPFKKQFMNEQEKKIHSMVQRLANLSHEHTKKKKEEKVKYQDKLKKRAEKDMEKRKEAIKKRQKRKKE